MRRRTYVALVGSTALGGCASTDSRGTDEVEPTTDGPATTTGQVAATTEAPGFEHQWTVDLPVNGSVNGRHYHAAVDGAALYVTTESELLALSLADGTERWRNSLGTPRLGVTASDDGLFTLTRTGELRSLNPETGDRRWGQGGDSDQTFLDGTLATVDGHVVATTAAGVVTVEVGSGERVATLSPVRRSFRVADGLVVAFDPFQRAADAYAPDGTDRWTVEDVSLAWTAPATGSALVGGDDRTVVGLDLEEGQVAWTTEVESDFFSPSTAATGDTAFVYDETGAERCSAFDVATGDIRWQQAIDQVVAVPPAALDTAVVINNDGEAQARDPRSGDLVDSVPASGLPSVGTVGVGRTFVGYGREVVAYTV